MSTLALVDKRVAACALCELSAYKPRHDSAAGALRPRGRGSVMAAADAVDFKTVAATHIGADLSVEVAAHEPDARAFVHHTS